ncbi:MAG: endonuclease [Bdellovibrionota bacterium]
MQRRFGIRFGSAARAKTLLLLQVILPVFFAHVTLADTTKTQNYYGSMFYALVGQGNSEQLKEEIKHILRGGHITTSGFDKIVDQCLGEPNCYQHTVIGYNAARVFLLGNYYLVQNGNSYAVTEVYCSRNVDASEFPQGEQPGPNKIPANTVVNVEHTWPQSRFSPNFPKETQKSDLHHLYPTDSKMNSTRGSFKFGEVVKDKAGIKCSESRFGNPQDSTELVFQPPPEHRGNVARALFYFSLKYNLKISPDEESVLRKWDTEDPVNDEDVRRNNAVFAAQKSRNPFVDNPGLAAKISDF